jgi:DNA topoisomerase VI subunit B
MTIDTEAMKRPDERIPMILTGHALQSLRDSGHSLPTALGEVIDNALEANANRIDIRLEQSQSRGKKHIHRVVIADDGNGMDSYTLHHYLVVGFSTRYMRSDTIGKYGVGAKLAALNIGRRIDVWSREHATRPWLHVDFDLDDALEQERDGIPVMLKPPQETVLPDDLESVARSGANTIVVWSRVDRLEEGRIAGNVEELRHEVEKELSRMFRYFINGGIKITVNEQALISHDPLMVMDATWADRALTRELCGEKRGRAAANESHHFPAQIIADEEIPVGNSTARLVVTLYPKEMLRKRGLGGDKLAKELRIPENQGAISFVRMNREVEYTNVPHIFASRVEDPDRFIGIEVSFKPDLDDFFGIRNVKRGVEPHGELRKKIRARLKAHVATARKMIEETWGIAAREAREQEGEHAAILQRVRDVDATMPKSRAEGPVEPDAVKQALEDLATDVGHQTTEAKNAYIEKISQLPVVIESVDFPGNMFMTTLHLAGKVIIRLNTRHPFYRDMWEPLKELAQRDAGTITGPEAVRTAQRSIEALTLLVVSYGKAESMHASPSEQYGDLIQYWGQFLSTLLKNVKNVA